MMTMPAKEVKFSPKHMVICFAGLACLCNKTAEKNICG
jgi:hypothetical protein